MGLLEGEEWRHRRQVFDPPFRHGASVARIANTGSAAKTFVESLHLLAATDGLPNSKPTAEMKKGDKESFTLHAVSAFMKFPFYLTAGVIYGDLNEVEERELWDLAQKNMALLPYFVIGGPYRFSMGRWLHPAAYRKLEEYLVGWRDCHERMVQRRRAESIKVPLVDYWDEFEANNITLDEVREPRSKLQHLLQYGF